MDKTFKWCNSFVLVQKASDKVRLCLDPARLNNAFMRHAHRDPTLNNVLPRLAGMSYLTLIVASSGYHNLKLGKKSSYLTNVSSFFSRYRYIRLPLIAALVGDVFKKKIDKLSSTISNVFGMADDILIAGFDEWGKDHNETLDKVA